MSEFDDAIEEIRAAAEAGTLVTVAWMHQQDNGNYRFGHKGYAEAREMLTPTLNNIRDGESPESPKQVN